MKKQPNLLKSALKIPVRDRSKNVRNAFPEDQLRELAVAYFSGKVRFVQASKALYGKYRAGDRTVNTLACALRRAVVDGEVAIKKKK